MAGILDWLNSPLPDRTVKAQSPWASRVGLFGATLKDIGASLGGGEANNVGAYQQGQSQMAALAQQQQARTALQQALATNDPNKIRAAALAFAAAGGDVSGIADAMKFGRPQAIPLGDGGVAQQDPFSGAITTPIAPRDKAIVAGGTVSLDGGRTFRPIPGFIDQASAVANARAGAVAAHRPPKAGATAPLSGPWARFGGK